MKVSITFLVCFSVMRMIAAAQQPVRWTYHATKLSESDFKIEVHAAVRKGWHIYAVEVPKGVPSIPTSISFGKSPLVSFVGNLKADGPLDNYQYDDQVTFSQVVRVKEKIKLQLRGEVTFMACNDHECLPPITLPFTLSLNSATGTSK